MARVPVRAWVQHIQAFGEAFGQKADAAHGEGQHSGEGARTGYPDENQSVNQKWDGADGNHQQAENRAYWGRSEPRVLKNAKGKARSAPIPVPVMEIQTVSNNR